MPAKPCPKLIPEKTLILIVDFQQRLLPAIDQGQQRMARAAILLESANLLNIPVIATEQYPAGLGPTCPTILHLLGDRKPFEKTRFSACIPPVIDAIHQHNARQIILAGIETHVCLQQTALDLLRQELELWLCADAAGSRRHDDHQYALDRLRHAGATVTTVESVIFELLDNANAPAFKQILKVVK